MAHSECVTSALRVPSLWRFPCEAAIVGVRGPEARDRAREAVVPVTMYLISFPSAAMVVADEHMPAVVEASHAVVRDAKDAGVLVFAGGLDDAVSPLLVGGDGGVREGSYPEAVDLNGGFTIVDVPTREAAEEWAARIAAACRCDQQVRPFMGEPLV